MFQFPKFYDLTLVLLTQRYVPFTFILKTNKNYAKNKYEKGRAYRIYMTIMRANTVWEEQLWPEICI